MSSVTILFVLVYSPLFLVFSSVLKEIRYKNYIYPVVTTCSYKVGFPTEHGQYDRCEKILKGALVTDTLSGLQVTQGVFESRHRDPDTGEKEIMKRNKDDYTNDSSFHVTAGSFPTQYQLSCS